MDSHTCIASDPENPENPEIIEFELGFVVMELVRGMTFKSFFNSRISQLNAEQQSQSLLWFLIRIVRSISALHAAGYSHRDLHRSNILLDVRGSKVHGIRLIDFGLSRKLEHLPPNEGALNDLFKFGEIIEKCLDDTNAAYPPHLLSTLRDLESYCQTV